MFSVLNNDFNKLKVSLSLILSVFQDIYQSNKGTYAPLKFVFIRFNICSCQRLIVENNI
jgi:hypothetical protein